MHGLVTAMERHDGIRLFSLPPTMSLLSSITTLHGLDPACSHKRILSLLFRSAVLQLAWITRQPFPCSLPYSVLVPSLLLCAHVLRIRSGHQSHSWDALMCQAIHSAFPPSELISLDALAWQPISNGSSWRRDRAQRAQLLRDRCGDFLLR